MATTTTTTCSDLLPLLHCPLCPPSSTLTLPVTLFCGHTVCAKHVSVPANLPCSSSSSLPQSHLPLRPLLRLTPCPLRDCVASPSAPTPPPSFLLLLVSPSTLPSVFNQTVTRLPFKLATVIHRYNQRQAQSTQRPPDIDSGSSTDSQTDEEIPDKAYTAGSSKNTPGDDVSLSSIPHKVSSDGLHHQGPARLSSARKRRRKQLPPPRRLAPAQSAADHFEKELHTELCCEICFNLLYQPITSPCQHTFCSKCLHRSLDHSNQCPICRQDLPGFSYFLDHPFNKMIISIMLKAFPEAYAERGRVIEQEERHARLDTPIFVCQLSFPGLPTILHFFEPRYRLMLRRCLEKENPCFGMIMPPSAAGGRTDFGTMLEIKSVRMLPDGRSMVETHGAYRFRIMERGTMDGYMVGRIERILDYPSLYPDIPGDVPSIPPPAPPIVDAEADVRATTSAASDDTASSTASESGPPRSYAQELQALVDVCLAFLDQIQRGAAPWVVQRLNRLNHIYGPMPTDPAHFSYWMAMALPIEDTEKAKLLPVKSPLLRLRLVVHWIEQLNSNWWFTNGCVVS
ncbi:PUA-like domain-containing protein [Russula compacta]|nr:PUA-like domain-containing protein [Russula compacta]